MGPGPYGARPKRKKGCVKCHRTTATAANSSGHLAPTYHAPVDLGVAPEHAERRAWVSPPKPKPFSKTMGEHPKAMSPDDPYANVYFGFYSMGMIISFPEL